MAIKEGYDVKVSEVHGMSQRGGSVVTYVKYGEKVYSPIIDRGEADLILAFEMLEAYRALPYLKEGGKILANSQRMNPMPVITGAMKYPDNIEDKLSENNRCLITCKTGGNNKGCERCSYRFSCKKYGCR